MLLLNHGGDNIKHAFMKRFHYKVVDSTLPCLNLSKNRLLYCIKIIHMAKHNKLELEQKE